MNFITLTSGSELSACGRYMVSPQPMSGGRTYFSAWRREHPQSVSLGMHASRASAHLACVTDALSGAKAKPEDDEDVAPVDDGQHFPEAREEPHRALNMLLVYAALVLMAWIVVDGVIGAAVQAWRAVHVLMSAL